MKQLPDEGRGGTGAVKPRSPVAGRSRSAARPAAKVRTLASIRLEDALERTNLQRALRRVEQNAGAPGADGMTVDLLRPYLRLHWPAIARALLDGSYRPTPVRRVLIPKAGGGERPLGIPTALDRFLQQAWLQVLQPLFDREFSPHSYGFRPGRSAHQAVRAAREHVKAGYAVVVDIDLASFFDRVHHDVLMGRLAKRIGDKRILRLIRRYLEAGVMVEGVRVRTREGTPQGGPLSPLLANVLLDDLDKELERRGHRFVRYADDSNVYVRSRRAGERVMAGSAASWASASSAGKRRRFASTPRACGASKRSSDDSPDGAGRSRWRSASKRLNSYLLGWVPRKSIAAKGCGDRPGAACGWAASVRAGRRDHGRGSR